MQVETVISESAIIPDYPVDCFDWKQKVDFELEQGKYQIRTIKTSMTSRVLDLRREVFYWNSLE